MIFQSGREMFSLSEYVRWIYCISFNREFNFVVYGPHSIHRTYSQLSKQKELFVSSSNNVMLQLETNISFSQGHIPWLILTLSDRQLNSVSGRPP